MIIRGRSTHRCSSRGGHQRLRHHVGSSVVRPHLRWHWFCEQLLLLPLSATTTSTFESVVFVLSPSLVSKFGTRGEFSSASLGCKSACVIVFLKLFFVPGERGVSKNMDFVDVSKLHGPDLHPAQRLLALESSSNSMCLRVKCIHRVGMGTAQC